MFPPDTRVLVVDDMKTMRALIKGQLRGFGMSQITEADTGAAGLQALKDCVAKGAPIQLVLSDWNMPEMTGLDFLKAVRADPAFKTLPFLLVTAEGEVSQVKDAIQAGVSNYVVKPFTPAILTEKLTAVWKKHNPGA